MKFMNNFYKQLYSPPLETMETSLKNFQSSSVSQGLQCYAMICYAMLCYAMLCYAMQCCAMLYNAMLQKPKFDYQKASDTIDTKT